MSDKEAYCTEQNPYTDDNRRLKDKYIYECDYRKRSNQEAYDKAILTLSSSLFAASIALFEWFHTDRCNVSLKGWFIATLICFGLAIISVIISFTLADKTIDSSIKHATEYYKKDQYVDNAKEEILRKKKNMLDKWLEGLNAWAGVFFVCGIACVVVFAIGNF